MVSGSAPDFTYLQFTGFILICLKSLCFSSLFSLINCFLVAMAPVSVSMSPTGDFLATAHVDSLGIYLWSELLINSSTNYSSRADFTIMMTSLICEFSQSQCSSPHLGLIRVFVGRWDSAPSPLTTSQLWRCYQVSQWTSQSRRTRQRRPMMCTSPLISWGRSL